MILYRKKFAGPLLIGAAVGTALALAPAAHAEPPYAEIRRVLDPDRKLLEENSFVTVSTIDEIIR